MKSVIDERKFREVNAAMPTTVPGRLGDGHGHVKHPTLANHCWVRIAGRAQPIYNDRVPYRNNLEVVCGYDELGSSEKPGKFMVLSSRTAAPGGAGVTVATVGKHGKTHQLFRSDGGTDIGWVDSRQIIDLMVWPYSGLQVYVGQGGVDVAGGVYKFVPSEILDMTAHVPTTPGNAALVLITVSLTGTIVATKGTEFILADMTTPDLMLANIPFEPSGTAKVLAAVRVYYGQIEIKMAASNLDIIDLRFWSNRMPIDTRTMVETIQQTGLWRGKAAKVWNILGRRAGFTSTSVLNDVKEFDNGVAGCPALSNSTLDIISDSVNDTNTAGTGVRQVKVVYLNATNVLTESAAINLNGTTLVTSVLTGVNAVLWMEAVVVGSGEVAAGNIRLRINGGTVEVEQITAGGTKSISARGRIPAGYTGYLVSWVSHAIGNPMDMRMKATVNTLDHSLSSVYHFIDLDYIPQNADSHNDLANIVLPATCDFKVSVLAGGTANTNRCDVSVIIALVAN